MFLRRVYRHSGPLGPGVHPANPAHPASDAEKARRGTGPRTTKKHASVLVARGPVPRMRSACLKQDAQDEQDEQDEAAGTPRIGQGGYPQRANGLARFFCQVDSPGFSPNANSLDI